MQLYLSFSLPLHDFPAEILAFVVIESSYLPFHATFDRGLKVRLFFARHNANHCLVCLSMLSTFFIRILPRAESATFLARHNGTKAMICAESTRKGNDFMVTKRRLGKDRIYPSQTKILEGEQKMQSGLSKHFSRERVLYLGHKPLKRASTIRIASFVPPSKIFVCGA
jgi:hypothetical protein